jgi:transposase
VLKLCSQYLIFIPLQGGIMGNTTKKRPDLKAIPMLKYESLYVGIDIGKTKHVAGFVSATLLERHERFEGCPAFSFEQSREGFQSLIDRICLYCPLEQVSVLLEHTGHYHRPLEQYLLEQDITVYRIHVQKRPVGTIKTDKRDALSLANQLYNQLALGVQIVDKSQLVHRDVPPTETAAQLKSLTRHRYELSQECTQRRNKLTSLCDEIFPEYTTIFKDPNREVALALREKFPTPQAVATASMAALCEVRKRNHPSAAQLAQLQNLARQSIGTKDLARLRGLIIEQEQLINELRLLQGHLQRLDDEIENIVTYSREGQILISMGIGPVSSASIIATIGSIANFERPGDLRSYFGWAPLEDQTGISYDRASLTPRGNRMIKQIMYLVVWSVIKKKESEWSKIYERLVPRLCSYDERTRAYKGKGKVIGRIAGQMIGMMYALLKKDLETLKGLAPGEKPPDPMLYDPEVHRLHRAGYYRSLKPGTRPRSLIHQVPKP